MMQAMGGGRLTDVIQLGPFLIKTATILYVFAGLCGYAAMSWRLKKLDPSCRKPILELVGSGAILGFMVWKFSYALFSPLKVWEYPASLLYFSGGERGLWLAAACVAVYAVYRMRKAHLPLKPVLPALAAGVVLAWGVGHLLFAWAWREDVLDHMAQAGLSLVLYVAFTTRTDRTRAAVALLGIAGLLGWGYLDQQETRELAQAGQSEGVTGLKKGNRAPDFLLYTLEGTPVRLSDLRGKKVILNMWATWCPPCRAEMPDMQEFYEMHEEKGVTILGVNLIETEQSEEEVARFLTDYGIAFPVVLDKGSQVSSLYQAISIPTSYAIDEDGLVREKVIGPLHIEMMEKMVSSME